MNRINETFSRSLRDALVRQVEETQRGRWRRRRRWQVGAGIGAVAVLAGGAGAAAAGFLHIPGSDIVTNLAEPAEDTYSGSTVIELGVPPESATHVSIELTCESAGTLYWEDGASMTCDEGELNASAMTSLPLEPGKQTTEIRTDDGDVQYRAKVTYVNHTLTDWAVNENGETYGGSRTTALNLICRQSSPPTDGWVMSTQPNLTKPAGPGTSPALKRLSHGRSP